MDKNEFHVLIKHCFLMGKNTVEAQKWLIKCYPKIVHQKEQFVGGIENLKVVEHQAKTKTHNTIQAHKHERQAERKILQKKFDEALVEHDKAKEYLIEALKLTNITQAVQSLTLQLEYHKKQKDIVHLKKTQYEIRKKILEQQLMKARQDIMASSSEDNSNEIQKAIFRTMEEADSLLDLLIINKNDIPTHVPATSSASSKPTGSKLPKTDKNVIEELHTINIQLKKLIKQLMNELSEKDRQIAGLKTRLKFYEGSNFSTPSDIWESQDSTLDPK